MTNLDSRQWSSTPLSRKDSAEKAIETAHQIAQAGLLVLTCVFKVESCLKIWLEDFNNQPQPYRYPCLVSDTGQIGRWIIRIHHTNPMYEVFLSDQPIRMIEFWFLDEPADSWHPDEPATYLTIKSVR